MITGLHNKGRQNLWSSVYEVHRKASPANIDAATSVDTKDPNDISRFRESDSIGENRETGKKLVVVANDFDSLESDLKDLASRPEYSDLPKIYDYLKSHITYTFLPEKNQDPNSEIVEVRAYGIIQPSFFDEDLSCYGIKNSDLIKLIGVLGKEAGVDSFLVPDMKKAYTGSSQNRLTFYGGYQTMKFFDDFSRAEIVDYLSGNENIQIMARTIADESNLHTYYNGEPNKVRFYARLPSPFTFANSEIAKESIEAINRGAGKERLTNLEAGQETFPPYVPPRNVEDLFDKLLHPETPLHIESAIRDAEWVWIPGEKKSLVLNPPSCKNDFSPNQVLAFAQERLQTSTGRSEFDIVKFDPRLHDDDIFETNKKTNGLSIFS
jgi:hypothetical protein